MRGLGSRLSEETKIIPKPLVKVGNKPILWHIMKYYKSYNNNQFILALGYKGKMIENYFRNNRKTVSIFNLYTLVNIHKQAQGC